MLTNNSSYPTKIKWHNKKVWHFTVEQDIPIIAYTEEQAEKEFHERYGNIPILGIIRPLSENPNYNTSPTSINETSQKEG